MLTAEQLAEIAARVEGTGPDDWYMLNPDEEGWFPAEQVYRKSDWDGRDESIAEVYATRLPSPEAHPDALFIAHAHQDVPALLADREALVALLREADGALQLLRAVTRCPHGATCTSEFCTNHNAAELSARIKAALE